MNRSVYKKLNRFLDPEDKPKPTIDEIQNFIENSLSFNELRDLLLTTDGIGIEMKEMVLNSVVEKMYTLNQE